MKFMKWKDCYGYNFITLYIYSMRVTLDLFICLWIKVERQREKQTIQRDGNRTPFETLHKKQCFVPDSFFLGIINCAIFCILIHSSAVKYEVFKLKLLQMFLRFYDEAFSIILNFNFLGYRYSISLYQNYIKNKQFKIVCSCMDKPIFRIPQLERERFVNSVSNRCCFLIAKFSWNSIILLISSLIRKMRVIILFTLLGMVFCDKSFCQKKCSDNYVANENTSNVSFHIRFSIFISDLVERTKCCNY
uniref:7TM_GPCR_Srx domain-containing protein n=1 Tax=Heterorhabditis bacteriophora TaxID=37862 RepID=A0A1I7WNS4_HETBA